MLLLGRTFIFVTCAVVCLAFIMSLNETKIAAEIPVLVDSSKVSPYRALVFGASGAIGKPLVDKLLSSPACVHVTTVGRRVVEEFPKSDKLAQHAIDMDLLVAYQDAVNAGGSSLDVVGAQLQPIFEDVDVVFICLGSTRKMGTDVFVKVDLTYPTAIAHLAAAAAQRAAAGARRLSHISMVTSMGANSNSFLLYPQTKGAAEEAVAAAGVARTSIFRPALLLTPSDRPRPDVRRGEAVMQWFQPCVVDPVLSLFGGLHKFRAIAVSAVAEALLRNAEATMAQDQQGEVAASPVSTVFNSDMIQLMSNAGEALRQQ